MSVTVYLIGMRTDMPVVATPPEPTVRPVPKRPVEARNAGTGRGIEGVEGDSYLPHGPTVWEAIGDLPNLSSYRSLLRDDETRLSSARLRAMEAAAGCYIRRLRGIEASPGDFSHPRAWDRALLTASMRTDHTAESIGRFRATPPGETEPTSRFYRLHPDGLCNTLRAGSGSERGAFTSPRPLHPRYPRVLSNREAARLHSFPDWFRPHATKWHGFRQIGNSVPPLLGRAVGAQIVAALGCAPARPSEPLDLGGRELLSLTMSQAAERFGAEKSAIPAPRVRVVARRRAAGSNGVGKTGTSEREGGSDRLSVVQIWQDFKMCAAKFPGSIARPIAAQFMPGETIAMFSFEWDGGDGITIAPGGERHYKLVAAEDLTDAELAAYAERALAGRQR